MLELYGTTVSSRLLLGTARYPSPAILADAVRASKTDIVTVSLRRESAGSRTGGAFFELIRALGVRVLPKYRRLPYGFRSGADCENGARRL